MGSPLTNKYAEGLPGKRYYGGCEVVDKVEQLAIDRAKQLFGADHANVQPHSGAQANAAVFLAFLKPGDTFLGMDLSQGGHLTHGSPVNFSGLLYKAVSYGVERRRATSTTDAVRSQARDAPAEDDHRRLQRVSARDRLRRLRRDREGGGRDVHGGHGALRRPRRHGRVSVAGAARRRRHDHDAQDAARPARRDDPLQGRARRRRSNKAMFPGHAGRAARARDRREGGRAQGGARARRSRRTAQQVVANAQALAEALVARGYQLVSGGTDNHLMLVDLRNKGLTGKVAEKALDLAAITVNKNTVPKETQSPFVTSGIRIGTPAVTTRGMREAEMARIAELIDQVLMSAEDASVAERVKEEVRSLSASFPLYPAPQPAHRLSGRRPGPELCPAAPDAILHQPPHPAGGHRTSSPPRVALRDCAEAPLTRSRQ